VQLSFRITPALKRELDDAAVRSGRSQSQEAEIRLERSFDHQSLLSEVLTLEYGKELAGLLMLFGSAMSLAEYCYALDHRSAERPASEADAHEQRRRSVDIVLDVMRPDGDVKASLAGAWAASEILNAVFRNSNPDAEDNPFLSHAPTIRSLLGRRIVERMAKAKLATDAPPMRELTARRKT